MATQIRVEINTKGVEQLLRSPEVTADLTSRGQRIASAAGPGVGARTFQGRDRVRVHVATETPEAMLNEATGRSLTRAIDAGRD